MPARRKSARELLLSGALHKNPGLYADRFLPTAPAVETVPADPLGDPPRLTRVAEKNAWREIAAVRPWLTAVDRLNVELTAKLMATMRNPKGEPTRADLALLSRVIGQLDKKAPAATVAAPAPTEQRELTLEELSQLAHVDDGWGDSVPLKDNQ